MDETIPRQRKIRPEKSTDFGLFEASAHGQSKFSSYERAQHVVRWRTLRLMNVESTALDIFLQRVSTMGRWLTLPLQLDTRPLVPLRGRAVIHLLRRTA